MLWEGDEEHDSVSKAVENTDEFTEQWRVENGFQP